MAISDAQLDHIAELLEALPTYGEHILKIRAKSGAKAPLIFNEAQQIVHDACEDQLRRTGKVRKLVLKGRQQGVSTYVSGRYYHKTTTQRGRNTYILSHEQTASDALFEMVDRYQKDNPFAPHVGNTNVKEMEFDRLDSSYNVATAGAKAGGRGKTMSFFHGSEVAFWPNARDHFSASVQTVPDLPGTEIILESTANGPSGEFYERWQDAIAGIGDYEPIFIPWHIQKEYRREDLVTEDFKLREDRILPGVNGEALFSEVEYAKLWNLDNAQMAWRRNKAHELKSIAKFDQEYPAAQELAFQQDITGAYQDPADIMRARKRADIEPVGPLVMGVDPAGEGGDRFAIAYRRGYCCYKVEWRDKLKTPDAVEWLKALIDEHDPAVVFIDAGGIGAGIISSLRAKGPRYDITHVRSVNFGAPSQHKRARPKAPGPMNRRAEMAKRVKEWLAQEEGVSLPDLDVLQADLIETKVKPTLNNDLQLESKQEIRKRGARSPDLADALGLTFADLFYVEHYSEMQTPKQFGPNDTQVISGGYPKAPVDEFGPGGSDSGWMG